MNENKETFKVHEKRLLVVVMLLLCAIVVITCAFFSSIVINKNDANTEYAPDSVCNSGKMSTAQLHKTTAKTLVSSNSIDSVSPARSPLTNAEKQSLTGTQSNVNSIGTTTKDANNNTVCTLREGGKITYAANSVLVSTPSNMSQSTLSDIFHEAGVSISAKSVISNTLTEGETLLEVGFTGNTDAYDLCKRLKSIDGILDAEPNYVQQLCGANETTNKTTNKTASETALAGSASAQDAAVLSQPDVVLQTESCEINDSEKGYLWHLTSTKAYDAWDSAKTSGKVTVVAIDSGTDYTHEDLADNLISAEFAKNTYTDETGADAVSDSDGHGTHVSGIIGAVANNAKGVAGVSYNAKVLPVRSSYSKSASYMSDIVEGIEYATNLKLSSNESWAKNIRIINLSLGGWHEGLTYAEKSINKAHEAGIMVVAAAGNDACGDTNPDYPETYKHYPSSYEHVVCVSATKLNNYVWDGAHERWYSSSSVFASEYSNYGSSVDISAPGTMIRSTYPSNKYAYYSGTSMSAPVVCGAAALLFSQVSTATPDSIENVLKDTSIDLGETGRDDYYGSGALNISAAVNALKTCENGFHSQVVEDAEQPATCTQTGLSSGTHCGVCGTVLKQQGIISPLGHDYNTKNDVVYQPTCTKVGYTTHTCSRCQSTYTDSYTNALGHNYASTVVTPTCVQQGYTSHVCTRCSDSYKDTYTPTIDHEYSDWVVTQEQTCTQAKVSVRTCSMCGGTETKIVPASGHSWGEWSDKPQADGSASKEQVRVCSTCGAEEVKTIGEADGATDKDPDEDKSSEDESDSGSDDGADSGSESGKGGDSEKDAEKDTGSESTKDDDKDSSKQDGGGSSDSKDTDKSDKQVTSYTTVYRLYNPITSEHLFTTSLDEYNALTAYDWKQESVSWYSPSTSVVGVYRLYNAGLGSMQKMSHHYTTDKVEADSLVRDHGWAYDNGGAPIFYSAVDSNKKTSSGAVACYRLYNGALAAHHYTLDANENNALVSNQGWSGEGIGFWAWNKKPA